jgi:hypothetical protein
VCGCDPSIAGYTLLELFWASSSPALSEKRETYLTLPGISADLPDLSYPPVVHSPWPSGQIFMWGGVRGADNSSVTQ